MNSIRDAVWNWETTKELPVERISTWRELHNLISRDARRKETANQTVPQDSKVYKALDGLEVAGYRLESVKETHELIDWGNQLSNCIAGYNREAVAERTFLFGIWQGDRLTGSMEVSGDAYVQQCVGFYNEYHAAKDEIQRAVTKALVRGKK